MINQCPRESVYIEKTFVLGLTLFFIRGIISYKVKSFTHKTHCIMKGLTMAKETKLSVGAISALEKLREGASTAQEIKAKGFAVNPAHLTALVNRGLATATKITLVCECCGAKRKVNSYELTEQGKVYSQE